PPPSSTLFPYTTLFRSFSALTLGVTLYAITRDQDAELAMLGMISRVVEGVLGAMSLRGNPGTMLVGATFFAVGSLLFSWLLLRGDRKSTRLNSSHVEIS